ncbi:crotonobetainyl-CoA:carnitine CoA-transferase CaiB-like acyl-CoA transferase [Novosphingobium kunmingense]|uniref:Crotonobetainyl-CoA:carnitine CoA-transferase CaiB-like acyl-CoA transferase n=1 Tax=Novosphingobium kunmingense TaxID=1211806 RepID=A0A2N0H5Y3_9SPHN|nr:CoA transferase [Novosphingobium kunmingense]PKB14338.1 crotonobetainyl-CoA:carnitine CoA-transferase CaiB-like acyl-CoA transferase [Novosphingobium kunmingense]
MLNELRIVEVGEGQAVQVAGLMLAALGAQVLKVERPGGDPARGGATFANWNRNKRSIVLDLDSAEGRAGLECHLAGADVLLHQFTPDRAALLGLDDATLAARFPRLVTSGITGSPYNHPDVERSDDELLVAARFGALYENDGYRAGPIVWRFNAGSWSAAHLAAAGILARLVARLQSGRGGPAHTSLFQGHMVMLSLIWARNSAGPMPNNPPHPLGARPIGQQLYECQGGEWLQIMDPPRQYDYANMPTMWEVLAEGVEIDTEEGKIEAFKRRPLEAWLADLRADDIAAEPAYPLGGMLSHPEVIANGYVTEIDDPVLGHTIQPNVPFHSDADLPAPRPAPALGEGGDADWTPPPAAVGDGRQPTEMLAGVRLVDFGMFLAGPMGPSMMGDMGADVIKVEALTGDRIRFMHRYYQAASRSKRSIAIDLTRPEAEPILDRLLKWAEAVHHNMRFKGAAKLGLSDEGIRKHNPDIAFNYVSAYGQRGTRGNWPGYDSIFNAIAGWEFENAGLGNKPMFNRPGTMDVSSAQSALVELMASLYAKRSGQRGYTTQTSLLGISALTQGETLILPDGSLAETHHLDSDQTGFSPYHRIFECSDGKWIAIAARTESRRAAVRSVLGDDEAGFAAKAKSRSAADLLAALEAAGVPCDLVTFEAAEEQFFANPLNRELNLISVLEQPLYGTVEQPGAYWCFGDVPVVFRHAAPAIGQHTDEIMQELGFSPAEIAGFRDSKVIG